MIKNKMKLKIGILQADDVVPHLATKYGEYPAMFQHLLRAANDEQKVDLEFSTYAVNAGVYPSEIDEVDAYILTGSKSSVYEKAPWIIELGGFVRDLHSMQKKLVGVCFGHQMVAHALGGETTLSTAGWSLGVKSTIPTEANSLGVKPFNLIYSHQDQITTPAEGTVVLASTDTCPIAATSLGGHILTFQGHPEFYPDYSSDLYEFRRENYPPETYKKAMDSFQKKVDQPLVAKMILNFCLN